MKRFLLTLAAAATLGACTAVPTPYQSATGERWGFEETRIEQNRFRVSFGGNALTDRDTVELYLLYRSAELTVENGFDYFELVDRAVDSETRYRSRRPRYSAFGVHYAYFHPRWGWRGMYDPFWDDIPPRESTRYEASAEIVLGHGDKPDHPRAFDARDVMANLGDDIVRPETD